MIKIYVSSQQELVDCARTLIKAANSVMIDTTRLYLEQQILKQKLINMSESISIKKEENDDAGKIARD